MNKNSGLKKKNINKIWKIRSVQNEEDWKGY